MKIETFLDAVNKWQSQERCLSCDQNKKNFAEYVRVSECRHADAREIIQRMHERIIKLEAAITENRLKHAEKLEKQLEAV